MKPLRSILTAGFALALLSTTVRGEVFPIVEDTAGSVTTGLTLKATGAAKTLGVSATRTAFFSFGVGTSAIDPATVTAARLTIFFPKVTRPGVLTFSNLDSAFAETFAGKNAPNPTIGAALGTVDLATMPLNREFLVVDITAQVKAWLTDPSTEFGIAVSSDGTASCTLASKEGAAAGHPAIIEVDVNRGGGSLSGTDLAVSGTANFTGSTNVNIFAATGAATVNTLTTTGNVGIGTTTPAARLNVKGLSNNFPATSGATQSDGLLFRAQGNSNVVLDIGANAAGGAWLQSASQADLSSNFPLLLNPNGGNVGIGTTAPAQPLHVLKDATGDPFGGPGPSGASAAGGQVTAVFDRNGHNTVAINAGGGRFSQILFGRPNSANNAGILYNDFQNSGMTFSVPGGSMTLQSGNLGIGIATPDAPLHVASAAGQNFTLEAFISANGGVQDVSTSASFDVSIHAAAGIRTDAAFVVASDARIKDIDGHSDGVADLDSLRAIEITNYSYKDKVTKGARKQKKVIAQQVEAVFPLAVNHGTGVVPDIYAKGTLAGGWVTADTDLKVGERVRLIGRKADSIEEVLEVKDGAFRTAFAAPEGDVFVYGREVKDFRTVDYEAIAMLNVSATQELARKLEAKDAEIAALKAANLALAEKLAAFGEQLTALQADRDIRPARTVRASLDLK